MRPMRLPGTTHAYSDIMPVSYELHWLPLLIKFKSINHVSIAPSYLIDFIKVERKSLNSVRSNDSPLLEVSRESPRSFTIDVG